ncbi:MAG: histidine kinase [Burkholderiales bacterium]|nr:histidine kinase [Burkholderiales bacterium]
MNPTALPGILAWSRVRFILLVALAYAFLRIGSGTPVMWAVRAAIVGLLLLVVFGWLERWPKRLPQWLARWPLQLVGVLVAVPPSVILAFAVTGGISFTSKDPARQAMFYSLLGPAVLFAPWITFSVLVRQRELAARQQAHTFELERSELERKAADAHLRLLQAQVQPHFLFNTLANVRALVNAGSPQAIAVLDSLIAYLRAAVPKLDQASATMGEEVQLARAYLELMHTRMPDRLQYSIHCDSEAELLRCPPVSLLTLVENAVRHGIDPSEEGGHIDVSVTVSHGRCRAVVTDSGVGLAADGERTGTGLASLRERLRLTFGDDAQLRIAAVVPHGVRAEFEFPAQQVTA